MATIEMTTDDLITRESLLASVGSIPAAFRTKYQRVAYVLSVLRSHANGLIAKAARSLYDGSISQMARRSATSTPEAIVDAVLERAHADLDELEREMAEETIEDWTASLNPPPGLPADLFPDTLLLPSQMTKAEQALCNVLDTWPVSGLFEQEPEPDPTSPASMPRPQVVEYINAATALAAYDEWEEEQIVARLADEWEDSDDLADYLAA